MRSNHIISIARAHSPCAWTCCACGCAPSSLSARGPHSMRRPCTRRQHHHVCTWVPLRDHDAGAVLGRGGRAASGSRCVGFGLAYKGGAKGFAAPKCAFAPAGLVFSHPVSCTRSWSERTGQTIVVSEVGGRRGGKGSPMSHVPRPSAKRSRTWALYLIPEI
eukprot:COSAG06_NODE_14144_length_1184_cov_1.595392_1_plen_162_part_00